MKIVVSNRSELPIYAQIREQIKQQILSGALPEGSMLPSIRGLAKELGVSVITTSRAFSDLEEQGFIAASQGRGSVVLSQDNGLLREQYLKKIEAGLSEAILTARQIGLTQEELTEMMQLLYQQHVDLS